jgi:cyclase
VLKKRLIFTLLYDRGHFMLSRNFRLQRVGDIRWLQRNYDFSKVSFSIDELLVLDVTRGERDLAAFCGALSALTAGCFVPIAAGGGVRSLDQARTLLRSGADKVVVNTPLYDDMALVEDMASEFGQQCVVASMDLKRSADGAYRAWARNGSDPVETPAGELLARVSRAPVGEIHLNSIDRDGTGQGYDLPMLDLLPALIPKPVILAGGAGFATHLLTGLQDARVDAVATAHLFNFVGDGLKQARKSLIDNGVSLPLWDLSAHGAQPSPSGPLAQS